MTAVLFDTNVVLDVLLDREPHAPASAQAMAMVERGEVRGLLCATTVTTLFYLASRALDARRARGHIDALLRLFDVAPVTRLVLTDALAIGFADYEDAVLHEAARHADAQVILTRNVRDFSGAILPVLPPDEFLLAWKNM